jgi:hypothetical protein
MLLLTCHSCAETECKCVGHDSESTVWQGDGKRLDLREHVGKLAVRQPGKVRAGSLAFSDLQHDALRHAAGQLNGDAAARHGNLDWRKRRRFGEQDPNDTNSCAIANPEGQADVSLALRGRPIGVS